MTADISGDNSHALREAYIAFTIRLAWALHRYGAPAHRLEEVLQLMSARFHLPGQFFSMPTGLLFSFGAWENQQTLFLRVEPGDVDLQKQVKLDALAELVALGELEPREGVELIEAIVQEPARYGTVLSLACYGLASGAASRFFGGGWREIVVSCTTGLIVGIMAMVMAKRTSTSRVFEPLAAVLSSLLAALGAWWLGSLSTSIAVLGGLIVLVPGLTVTTALNELATRNLMSGTGRLMGAVMIFLVMGVGVALGTQLAEFVPERIGSTIALPAWTEGIALAVGLIAFSVLFRVPMKETPFTFLVGAVIYGIARLATASTGADLAVGLAAFSLGAAANLYARLRRRPSGIVLVPSLMLLVPGSIGFRSLVSLLEHNVLSGVEAAFRMIMVGVSLVTGLLLANLVLPPRRAL